MDPVRSKQTPLTDMQAASQQIGASFFNRFTASLFGAVMLWQSQTCMHFIAATAGLHAQIVQGLDEGIRGMKVGGVRRMYVPGNLSFPKGVASAPGRCVSSLGHPLKSSPSLSVLTVTSSAARHIFDRPFQLRADLSLALAFAAASQSACLSSVEG